MDKLRNVAIIAHVDHGKTTLVDEMLKQSGVYRENQEVVDRVMDSNDLERERGITIMAKNTAVWYGDTKINIVDTPGHADFGGEVERILKMVNGVILLVDAAEGPMPQTRFVLSRALELGHRVIVVVNKIDRPDQRIHDVIDEILELLMDLNATDEQLDSPMLFCSGRNGTASYSPDVAGTDLKPLFETILEYIPAPEMDDEAPFQMLVSSIDYNEYVGRIAIGRIERGVIRQNQEIVDRVMDSNDLERERGITIMAKNTAVWYGDTKINIVDTPGHADFGGEVERILKMVNGVILLVDAAEGPMPQTRFVLSRALELGHRVIVVVNKIDRPDQRIHDVIDEILELLMDLNATDEQLDSPMLFCSGRQGTASYSPDVAGTDLKPLFETILEYIPEPEMNVDAPFQMLVSSVDYNEYVGRIAIGRIERGVIKQNQEIEVCNYHDPDAAPMKAKAVSLYQFDGLNRVPVTEASAGNIIAMSGIGNVTIGDTVCARGFAEPLPFVKIGAPTLEMTFSVNDSPFAGKEGKFVTSRQISDRLYRETLKDVSLRVTDVEGSTDSFNVAGRGEMSLSILIETMRREGYEFQVSPPRVLYREIDGKKCEPIERVVVDVPQDSMGAVMEKLGSRKGEFLEMTPVGNRMKMEFLIPSRGLFGYRNEFLTDTKGEGILASVFEDYRPYKGDLVRRHTGSLIAHETGEAVAYGIWNAQDRGVMFITPGTMVYGGMIVGECPKQDDIQVNVCRTKHLTNTRASGSDEALRLIPPKQLSLEQCLEFLADDELLEVTPKNLRLRKSILDHGQRMKNVMKNR